MKKGLFLAVLAVVFLSGCGARNISMSPPISTRATLTPNVETLAVNNNSVFDLVVQEGGITVRERTRDRSIKYYRLPTGESIPLGYYEFFGSSRISLVAKAYCPQQSAVYTSDPQENTAERAETKTNENEGKKIVTIELDRKKVRCYPNQYMGMTRPFYVYVQSGQNYRSSDWNISNWDIMSPAGRTY